MKRYAFVLGIILHGTVFAADRPFQEEILDAEPTSIRAFADEGGVLHIVWSDESSAYYATGKPGALGRPVKIGPGPRIIAGAADRGPWLDVGERYLLVLWQTEGGMHAVRSEDGGAAWKNVTVSDGQSAGIDMPAMVGGPGGIVYVVWVDGRDGRRPGDPLASELYMSVSTDGGRRFGPNIKITGNAPGVCPCCQPMLRVDSGGDLWIAYRSSSKGVKEIQLLRVHEGKTAAIQVSKDAWRFDGCPMAGPQLAVAGKARTFLLSWRKDDDLYFSASTSGTKGFRAPERLGRGRYHAAAADGKGRILLLWDEGSRTGYREFWKDGASGRVELPAKGVLVGLPEGFVRVRGR